MVRWVTWPVIVVVVGSVFVVYWICVWWNRRFGKPLTMSQQWVAKKKVKDNG